MPEDLNEHVPLRKLSTLKRVVIPGKVGHGVIFGAAQSTSVNATVKFGLRQDFFGLGHFLKERIEINKFGLMLKNILPTSGDSFL